MLYDKLWLLLVVLLPMLPNFSELARQREEMGLPLLLSKSNKNNHKKYC
jgi:hypothetical protein